MRFRLCCAAFLAALSFVGCNEKELVSGLDGRQSLEVIVALSRAGISAERERSGGGRAPVYSVSVADGDFESAAQVLTDAGLPRESDTTLETLTQSNGLLPASPELGALRVEFIMSQQIERQLLLLPRILDAKVVVRRGDSSKRGAVPADRTRVSAIVRTNAAGSTNDIGNVKDLVRSVLPDVTAEDITVQLVRTSTPAASAATNSSTTELSALWPTMLFNMEVPERSKRMLQVRIALVILGSSIFCLLSGFFFGMLRSRRRAAAIRTELALRSAQNTNGVVENGTRSMPAVSEEKARSVWEQREG